MNNKHDRDIRRNPLKLLPELSLIGRTEIEKALPTLDIASESGCAELFLAYKGRKRLACEGTEYELNGGDFFYAPPGVGHTTAPLPLSKCAHYWIRVNLGLDRPFLGDAQYEPLRKQLKKLPITAGAASETCHEYIRRIYDLVVKKGSTLDKLEIQLTFGVFLLKMAETVQNNAPKAGNPDVERIIDFMRLHIGEDLSVTDFAREAGYSASAFQALFRKAKGISPKEYFTRMKMDWSKELLSDSGKSIIQISNELGFSTSQYFSTTFKKYFAISPGEYRRSLG